MNKNICRHQYLTCEASDCKDNYLCNIDNVMGRLHGRRFAEGYMIYSKSIFEENIICSLDEMYFFIKVIS